jgi:transposase
MDASEPLLGKLQTGQLDPARLVDVVRSLQRQLQATQQQLQAAQQRIAELEQQRGGPRPHVAEPFSVRAEEQRQEVRGKTKKRRRAKTNRRGRLRNSDKIKLAARSEPCFPAGVPPQECWLSHTRPAWRLENGQALLVAYHIYRGPKDQYGQIPGVLGRSEFGLEIVVEIAYLMHVLGLSFDKVCEVLRFLQNLRVGKSQAEALLRQLARHWQSEFDVLVTLLANSLVVHADETSWSLNSVWALLSEQARILLFGVHKDADTLKKILDPATFAGLVISDDAAVYANFSQAQKCWAHLLRKAIKLTLLEPDNTTYREFTDRLLAIYRRACRVQRDGRRRPAGRERQVAALEDEVLDLCAPQWLLDESPLPDGPANAYRLLVNEVLRLAIDGQLFVFVTATAATQPNGQSTPVAGTNNEAERTLRGVATARKTGRTNKTLRGARRQTILVSVLESLRVFLPQFTLGSVVAEVAQWCQRGQSCFHRLLTKLQLVPPQTSLLDQILPVPDC